MLRIILTAVAGLVPSPAVALPDLGTRVGPRQQIVVAADGDDGGRGSDGDPLRTVEKALEGARPPAEILVRGGVHPVLLERTAREAPVTIRGLGERPVFEGAILAGAGNLRFEGVAFRGKVRVEKHSTRGAAQPASDITFDRVGFTTGQRGTCLTIRDSAVRIAVRRSRFAHCNVGIGGPNISWPPSEDITIEGNVIEHVAEDGIKFADWNGVRIVGNVIRHARDPAGVAHNDGIQFVGNSRDVRIMGNRIHDTGQLVFLQNAVGPIDDLVIANNVLSGSSSYAVQVQGATRVRFVNNTVWDSKRGALLVRSGYGGSVPRDVDVVNNILDGFLGGPTRTRDFNLIGRLRTEPAAHELVGVRPRFRDVAKGDYRLRGRSPGRDRGSRAWSPPTDLDGRLRRGRPSMGAYE